MRARAHESDSSSSGGSGTDDAAPVSAAAVASPPGCGLRVLAGVSVPLGAGRALLLGAAGGILDCAGAHAVVNAANEGCVGGGGVDGAVNAVGGSALVRARRLLGGCATGCAKATPAFGLARRRIADWIVHAVGPDLRSDMPHASAASSSRSLKLLVYEVLSYLFIQPAKASSYLFVR
jgi:hypothetical protein